MRISARETDPGYELFCSIPKSVLRDIRVFLNGQPVRGAVTADDQERMVEAFMYDSLGEPVLNEARDAIALERLYGRVEIQLPEVSRGE